MKRGASGLCGVLAIDKPGGMSSHDVVNRVRRLTGERRVGHAGTLDPMATGLLLVGVGAATRLSPYLSGHDKTYEARIVFGISTDTDDAEGRAVDYYEQGKPGEGTEKLDGLDPQDVLDGIVGRCDQMPPAFSAIKKNGVTAYKAAREGKKLELEARSVEIYSAKLQGTGATAVDLDDGKGGRLQTELPYWDVVLRVSKGTYIRSIARDLGLKLGCGAHLGALRRTAVAGLTIEEAHTLGELERISEQGAPLPWANPASLLGFPILRLSESQERAVANGCELRERAPKNVTRVSCVSEGKLLAVYERAQDRLKPATVIPGGVVGVV